MFGWENFNVNEVGEVKCYKTDIEDDSDNSEEDEDFESLMKLANE